VETQGKYFSGGSTAFSLGLHILRKSNRRILKRSEIKSPNFEAVEAWMAQVEEKRNTVADERPAERCSVCLVNPSGIAFLLSKQNTVL
jgi:hypothetical protein